MKIENIIEDIIQDTIDIKDKLEAQIKKEDPQLNFAINLPEIEKLSAIKLVELTVKEDSAIHTFRAEIHTHNGYRVFENIPRQMMKGGDVPELNRHHLQDWFIDILREIIKRKKLQLKSAGKSNNRHHSSDRYTGAAC